MLLYIKRLMKSNALFTAGIIILVMWLIVACLSPIIAPFDPVEQDYANRLKPPTSDHIFKRCKLCQ